MKIEKYKNLTFNDLYNLECFQNTQIQSHLVEHMNKLIIDFFDDFGEIDDNDKIYFHCFVLHELCFTSNQIIVFVSINKIDIIGGLIIDFEMGYNYLLYSKNDIEFYTMFELLLNGVNYEN